MNNLVVTVVLVVLLLGVIGVGAYFILGKDKTDTEVEEVETDSSDDVVNSVPNNIASNPVNRQATTNTQASSSRFSALFGSGGRRRSSSSSSSSNTQSSSSSSSSSSSNQQSNQQIPSPPALPESGTIILFLCLPHYRNNIYKLH